MQHKPQQTTSFCRNGQGSSFGNEGRSRKEKKSMARIAAGALVLFVTVGALLMMTACGSGPEGDGMAAASVEREQQVSAAQMPQRGVTAPSAKPSAAPAANVVPPTVTPTVTVPPTPAHWSEPAEMVSGGTLGLSNSEYTALNRFMSFFSETEMDSFVPEDTHGYTLLNFVHFHLKINDYKQLELRGDDYTMTKKKTDECLERFFGITMEAGDYYSPYFDYGSFKYSDGVYATPAADGASFNRFSIVTRLSRYEDGTLRVGFTVYELDIETYHKQGIPDEIYAQTGDTIRSCGYGVEWVEAGEAVIRPHKLHDGTESYQLLTYGIY